MRFQTEKGQNPIIISAAVVNFSRTNVITDNNEKLVTVSLPVWNLLKKQRRVGVPEINPQFVGDVSIAPRPTQRTPPLFLEDPAPAKCSICRGKIPFKPVCPSSGYGSSSGTNQQIPGDPSMFCTTEQAKSLIIVLPNVLSFSQKLPGSLCSLLMCVKRCNVPSMEKHIHHLLVHEFY